MLVVSISTDIGLKFDMINNYDKKCIQIQIRNISEKKSFRKNIKSQNILYLSLKFNLHLSYDPFTDTGILFKN